MHDVVRRLCIDHVERERDHFSQYITQDFEAYVARKRRDGVFGNHLEIQAISEIYNRPIHVYDAHGGDADTPMNAFTASTEGEPGAPLRLSYHGRSHYNVIFDPSHADAGVGLGLPGLEPGMADRMQLEQAATASEESALEAQLLYEVQTSSEVEATQEAILQAALRASLSDMTGQSAAGPACGGGSSYNDEGEDLKLGVQWAVAQGGAASSAASGSSGSGGGGGGGGTGDDAGSGSEGSGGGGGSSRTTGSSGAGSASAGAVDGGSVQQLSEEDDQAVVRLMALGFTRPIAQQAFLACEKNENQAANFLFDF